MIRNNVTYDFSDQVVVVTGGARGQGMSHVAAFADAGATVVVFDIEQEELKGIPYGLSGRRGLASASRRLTRQGASGEVLNVDVRDEDAVREGFVAVQQRFGKLDILVNNAGVNSIHALDQITTDEWEAVLDVNLRGAFLCSKYAAQLLKGSGGGSIILVGSLAAIKGVYGQAHYAASKAGLIGLMNALAVELGAHRVRVNAISPSIVLSPQTLGLSKATPPPTEPGSPSHPVNYGVLPGASIMPPSDVTAAVLWLASGATRNITGNNIVIDAGRSLI